MDSQFEALQDADGNFTGNGVIRIGIGIGFDDKVNFNGLYAGAHEMYHAYQFDQGVTGYMALNKTMSANGKISMIEMQAVGFENYMRASLNEVGYNTMRTYYSSSGDGISRKLLEYTKSSGSWTDYILGKDDWTANDFTKAKKNTWIGFRQQAVTYQAHKAEQLKNAAEERQFWIESRQGSKQRQSEDKYWAQ